MERIYYLHAFILPKRTVQSGPVVFIVFVDQLLMVLFKVFKPIDIYFATGTTISVMLCQVKNNIILRYLHIDGGIITKPMFPVDFKPKPINVKFDCFPVIKYSKYWKSPAHTRMDSTFTYLLKVKDALSDYFELN